MYDQVIRRFVREGKVKSDRLLNTRERFSHSVIQEMKALGFLPLLDLEASWWVSYIPAEDSYKVRYSDQAIHYGKEDIDQWEGWLLGELIPTTKKASKTLSKPSE